MVPEIARFPVHAPAGTTRTHPGEGLLAFATDSPDGRPLLMLSGTLGEQSGPVLAEALPRVCRQGALFDLSGIRGWNSRGLARLLEVASEFSGVTVRGAPQRLAEALRDAQPHWEVVDDLGDTLARRAHDWARQLADACGQALDVAFAALLLLILLPVLLAIAGFIRLDSRGPVVYTQLRAGVMRRDGSVRVFKVFKFRTMISDADRLRAELMARAGGGPFFKLREDPRVTRVGRILRATSLDELPQLLNVVRGEMRLVGNRPLALDEASRLTEPWQRVRFRAPAGLTGLWQVSGRSEASDASRCALDSAYAASRTPWLDLRILLMTVPAVLGRKGW